MLKHLSRTAVVALIAILVVACNLPLLGTPAPTEQPMTVETVVALTLAAQNPGSAQAPSGDTQVPTAPTNTPPPTSTPLPTATLYPTYTSIPTYTPIPCNTAGFVSDITIPDNTTMTPGQSFTKTWRIRNNGSCTWSTSYKVVFDSGDSMSGPASFNLPGSVAPNQTIDISVDLKAPTTPNSTSKPNYKGNWKLQDQNGVIFGLGGGNSPFYVQIVVNSASFAVTRADVSAEHSHIEAACPNPGGTFNLSADITSTTAGTVTYYWKFSDGSTSPTQSVTFSSGDTKTVTYSYTLTSAASMWVDIYIDKPNHQEFTGGKLSFDLVCTP
ncbi:MAG TPA: NBR1-Ig-like domain-containing protein [Longilinea sp.]|nr:NBR1-Ig-like domain-containing protein [Longilinea sp.]